MPDGDDQRIQDLAEALAARQTAALTGQVEALTATNVDLQNRLDVAEQGRQTAEQEREAARTELAEYRTQVENERQAATRLADRMATLRRELPAQSDEWFSDESRQQRVLAMDDDAFTQWVGDLKSTAPTSPGGAPRQTAMTGDVVPGLGGSGAGAAPAAAAFFAAHQGGVAPATKGA